MDTYDQTQSVMPSPVVREGGSKTGLILSVLALVLVLALAAGGVWLYMQLQTQQGDIRDLKTQVQGLTKQVADRPTGYYKSTKGVGLYVFVPTSGATVNTPLAVAGMVPGNWAFENVFPVKLKDASGKVVASGNAALVGTWTTDKLQPFTASIVIPTGQSGDGTLVIEKDNPSGLADKADSVSISVKF